MNIAERIETVKSAHTSILAKIELIEANETKRVNSIEANKKKQKIVQESMKWVTLLTDQRKKEVIERMENLVTKGLRAIFDSDDYSFKIETTIKRKQVNYLFFLKTKETGDIELPLMDSRGGGVLNVISFVLRLLTIVFCSGDDSSKKFMIVDEPFKNLSDDREEGVNQFILDTSSKLGVQVLMVSHRKGFEGDVNVELKPSRKGVIYKG